MTDSKTQNGNSAVPLMKAKGQWDWKFAESPLVDGDRVIVTSGAKDAALTALDKATGQEVWRTALADGKVPEARSATMGAVE